MRKFFAFLPAIALTLAFAPAIGAETTPPPPAKPAAATPESRLETLFGELKRERNERKAERIAARIFEEWNRSGSASIDLMMQWSQKAMQAEKFDVALDFLDQVVTLSPTYAEGWNRRATVHFMMRSFGKSMADIDRTLQLEPRHFGALAGLGMIMQELGDDKRALDAFRKALEINPHLEKLPDMVKSLTEKVEGRPI
jgi:tetratricopeptide (TPR) repeat protein